MAEVDIALFRHFPDLGRVLPWVNLGDFPTPIESLTGGDDPAPLYVKREDLSSPAYGGNKVRTLEAHMGAALAHGASEIWATGAYGSNHAIATVTHARRVGLEPGVMLWPQPPTDPARANMLAMLAMHPFVDPLASVVTLPWGMTTLPRRCRRPVYLMSPGGATEVGAVAHVSAAIELAEQVRAGDLESPAAIVLAVGSTCTTAGLLLGLQVASRLGIAFTERLPIVHSVRVTPWPITSRLRIAHYAERTGRYLGRWLGSVADVDIATLWEGLRVDRRFLGRGYGQPTRSGRRAITTMAEAGGPPLDVVYSAKSGAAFFRLADEGVYDGPLLFWATKSSAPLPRASERQIRLAPRAWRRWLTRPLRA